jgi:hypothetical protein
MRENAQRPAANGGQYADDRGRRPYCTRHRSNIMATQTSPQPQKPPKPGPEHAAPPASHQEDALDEALDETFPSSDPIAVSIPKPSTTPL